MGDTPPLLRCTITHAMFLDPVIASDGHTYERADIMEWMNHNTISPMTREPLERALVPNILIRQQVNEERGRRGLPTLPTLAELDAAIKIQSAFRAHRAQQVPLSLLPSKSYLILCLLCWSGGRSRT